MKEKTVLVLRSCRADMTSTNGFEWPTKGTVKAPDWKSTPICGNGLHGFLWGEGDASLAFQAPDAKWLVLRVKEKDLIQLGGKVKFPSCRIIFCGSRDAATDFILQNGAIGKSVIYGKVTAGYKGTATAGYKGTATAGYKGTATAGDSGTATAGDSGTATAGYKGILQIKSYDLANGRYRIHTAYVGENGIKADIKYRLNENNLFVPA